MFMIIATYAKAAGLSRDEASRLWSLLISKEVPNTVDGAWQQLDEATQHIRQGRDHA